MRPLLLILPFLLLIFSGAALILYDDEIPIEVVESQSKEIVNYKKPNVNKDVNVEDRKSKAKSHVLKLRKKMYDQKVNSYPDQELHLLRLSSDVTILGEMPTTFQYYEIGADEARKEALERIQYAIKMKSNYLDLSIHDLNELPDALLEIPKLEILEIKNTKITDYSLLSKVQHLEYVDLRNSPIKQLGPFHNLKSLKKLWLTDVNWVQSKT